MLFKIIKSVFCKPIEDAQDEYMKDHILTPNPEDWRDDRSWRR